MQSLTHTPAAGMRVLVVDDEPAIRLVVARYLTRRGHRVEEARDGADAMERITSGGFDRILADLRMPGMGGAELYHRLEERGLADRLVFITGDAVGDDLPELLAAGRVPVLEKPFHLEQLAALVEQPLLRAA